MLSLDVEGDKNLVDLAFAGEELDLIYLMSEQHLYKISGQKIKLTLTIAELHVDFFRNGSYGKKRDRLHLATRFLNVIISVEEKYIRLKSSI